ncbi:MAG: 3-deoxy-manno-octulosonate cytidylyltransferase [Comamonadaceae bacterium]|nr:MAG: 3-deoxy-manno-octulosonate cytidylyltransferase [Comamonadaceae bacterium]
MKLPEFTVLIPARLASTRLPDKPLADIAGIPMVVHVARRALRSGASRVVVAADHERISSACVAHGIDALLTRADHPSGSDRLAEACGLLGLHGASIVVNVQGDEPLIEPTLIDAVAAALDADEGASMSTAAHRIASPSDFSNPNVVKVVTNAAGSALYFSRAPIPWPRDDSDPSSQMPPSALRHIGIYAYRASFLSSFAALSPSPLECIEQLEQLRALWHGHRIAVHVTGSAPGPGVDTPADLAAVRLLFARN